MNMTPTLLISKVHELAVKHLRPDQLCLRLNYQNSYSSDICIWIQPSFSYYQLWFKSLQFARGLTILVCLTIDSNLRWTTWGGLFVTMKAAHHSILSLVYLIVYLIVSCNKLIELNLLFAKQEAKSIVHYRGFNHCLGSMTINKG